MTHLKRRLIVTLLPLLIFSCSGKQENDDRTNLETVSWPIFRGDTELSGVAETSLPDKLKLLWSFQAEDGIISSPVIGSGCVYIGSLDGKVYSIDLVNGEKNWAFDTGDWIEASPLLLNQTVYIGSLSGDFFAIDAKTGQIRWQTKMQGEIYGSANWARKPETEEITIMVGSYDTRMYCFQAETGKLIWTYETDYYINGSPATDGVHVVFGGCDEHLHIVTVADGSRYGAVWAGSYIAGSAALVDHRAYVGHYNNKLVCIDIPEKRIVWEYEDKEGGGEFFSSPAVGMDRILIGSRDGMLHCIDRKTGQNVWTFKTRDEVDSSPVIVGDRVVVGSTDGRLYIVKLETGDMIWSYEIGAALISSPAVAGGMIIIGGEDGRLYAFGEDS